MTISRQQRSVRNLLDLASQQDIDNLRSLRSAEPVHPGEYLQDELDARGWDIAALSLVADQPYHYIALVLDGELPLTEVASIGIARTLGTSTDLWLNLQRAWDQR